MRIQLKWHPEEHKRLGQRGRIICLRLALDPGPCIFQRPADTSVASGWTRSQSVSFLPNPLVVFIPSRAKRDYVLSSVGRVGFVKQPPQGDRNHPICAGPHLVRCLFHRILFQTHLIVRNNACSVVMEIGWLLFFI